MKKLSSPQRVGSFLHFSTAVSGNSGLFRAGIVSLIMLFFISSCSFDHKMPIAFDSGNSLEQVAGVNDPYAAAEIQNPSNITLTPGTTYKIEWNAKVAPGQDAISLLSFFDSSDPWSEITFEFFGGGADGSYFSFQSQYICIVNGSKTQHLVNHTIPAVFNGGLHNFVIIFRPAGNGRNAYLEWQVDGSVIRTETGGDADNLRNSMRIHSGVWKVKQSFGWGTGGSAPLLDTSIMVVQNIMLSSQVSGNWQTINNWTFQNQSSLGSWMLSNWTFDAMDGYYIPANAQIRNGALSLILSTLNPHINNIVPVANAGSDQTAAVNSPVTLDGRLSKDADNGPSPLGYLWTQIAGPSTVILTQATTSQPGFTPTVAGSYTFRLTVNDGAAASSDDVIVTATGNTYVSLPGRIQAKDYNPGGEGVGYHDLTVGNSGGKYRNDDVDIEACSDVGGGYNVGWIDTGEWLAYNINVTQAGTYTFTARMASATSGTKTMTVSIDGSAVAAFGFTDASGWQSWKDVSVPNVNLTAGNHVLRMNMTTGGFNVNYLDIASTVSYTLSTVANPAAAGTISGGGSYASGATATLAATPAPGYTFSNWSGDVAGIANPMTVVMNANKSVTANFTPAASYTIIATAQANGSVSPSGTVSVGQGADQTFTMTPDNGYSVDLVTVDGVSQGSITSYTFSKVMSNHTINVTFKTNGTFISLPGRIQAEDYKSGGEGSGYHDLTKGNTGGAYRNDDVDIEACSDAGGGYNVGWTDAGEWLAYDVNVMQAGFYTFTARMASAASGTKTMTVTVDGAAVAVFSFTDASGWQSWKNVVVPNINLTAGNHALRLVMTTNGFNVNYLDVSAGASNLLTNGDFANGLSSWQTLYMEGAAGAMTNDAGSAKIAITSLGPNPWDIQIYQNVSVIANKLYTLEFDMKAAATPKNFKVVVEHDGGSYTKYLEQQYTVTSAANTYQHFVSTFTPNATDSPVKIGFHFGTFNTNSCWLDNVTLK